MVRWHTYLGRRPFDLVLTVRDDDGGETSDVAVVRRR
jgi:hypothetical protein